jgi:hypothetical protein
MVMLLADFASFIRCVVLVVKGRFSQVYSGPCGCVPSRGHHAQASIALGRLTMDALTKQCSRFGSSLWIK